MYYDGKNNRKKLEFQSLKSYNNNYLKKDVMVNVNRSI